ncbi:hypothetical protein [Mangrovibacterium diazotrophicum]|uniref:Uncharacterized protein n=1 Tax=Mangrovibacterium diazotrophicum TaxID=1261403 RepID=A0A419W9M9_9BACT|nr:hypothetical protein [Mangrovibacterium diazotrophicum]RKD92126.1 hypothetical protein BC643_2496 [Mangrovibacterium diazotrophicum]
MAKGIRFHYLYRDSGNYKKFGHKDFSNPTQIPLTEIETAIRERLISTEFFDPDQVGIRKFLFHRYNDDHSWYEFEKIEEIEIHRPTASIEKFLLLLELLT